MSFNRREFLKNSALLAGFAWIATKASWVSEALAAEFKSPPPAGKNIADSEKGPGKTNKYVHHKADYKGAKKANFTATANCANCNFYKPEKAGDAWGKCTMLGNAYVYQDGLCQLWQKKPGT